MDKSNDEKTDDTVCIKFVFSHTECYYEVSLDPNTPASKLANCKEIAHTAQKFLEDFKIPEDEGFRIFPSPDLEDDSPMTAHEWTEMSGAIIVCPENPQIFSELLINAPANNIALDLLLVATDTPQQQQYKDARTSKSARICSGCVDLGMKIDRLVEEFRGEMGNRARDMDNRARDHAREMDNLARDMDMLKNGLKVMQAFVNPLFKIYRRQVLVQARLKISELLGRQPECEDGISKWRDFMIGISPKELEDIGLTAAAVNLLARAIKDGDDVAHRTPVPLLASAFTSIKETELASWSKFFLLGTGVTLEEAVSDDWDAEEDIMMESMSTLAL